MLGMLGMDMDMDIGIAMHMHMHMHLDVHIGEATGMDTDMDTATGMDMDGAIIGRDIVTRMAMGMATEMGIAPGVFCTMGMDGVLVLGFFLERREEMKERLGRWVGE